MRLHFSDGSKCSNPEEFGLRLTSQKGSESSVPAGNHLGVYDRAIDILGTSMEEDNQSIGKSDAVKSSQMVILHSDYGDD